MKKIVMFAIVLIAAFSLNAQNQIEGKVLELSKDGNFIPVFGANVYWEGTSVGTITDITGDYSINEAESFPATLSVSYVGYTVDTNIFLNNQYVFYLKSSVDLDEVQVKGKVNTTRFSTINSINIQTLSTGELEKAACCNLSESFSTNATIDVTFTDAVSGAKRIQMLGLDGVYTQITQENIPLIRGLSSSYGLSYTPGPWIESIQIIKGNGSVVNGFESFTGQINFEYYKPEEPSPRLFWNGYTNSEGKIENNLLYAKKQGNWKSNLFTHISYFDKEVDNNKDGFLDMPKVTQFNILNRWKYYGSKKIKISFIARGLVEDRLGGTLQDGDSSYTVNIQNDLLELSTKTGIINSPGKSIGLQTALRNHNQTAVFGDNNYKGLQESIYINLIRQTYFGNTNHIFKYGVSSYTDRFTETFAGNIDNEFTDKIKVDLISGLFSEYSFKWNESFNITAGLRADYYNNSEKINYIPRLNIKYNPSDETAVRFSAGRAFRIANVFVENASFLASRREIILDVLKPEIAWNYGANITHCFYFLDREGTINADVYRTVFDNQIVVDIETQGELAFYNLEGTSYANSIQLDLAYEVFEHFDVKMAYKINDVKSTFSSIEKITPLTPKNRTLLNFSYATNSEKWKFDLTANYIGESRIPAHSEINQEFSDPFKLYNAQITKKLKAFDVYLGVENILSYTQDNPILLANNPNSSDFDASLIYAPINGRMLYFGFRYKLD